VGVSKNGTAHGHAHMASRGVAQRRAARRSSVGTTLGVGAPSRHSQCFPGAFISFMADTSTAPATLVPEKCALGLAVTGVRGLRAVAKADVSCTDVASSK
jgi:hypothetical protein